MKKLVLALLIVANSLFAVTLAEIDLGTHPRAFITQVDLRDKNEWATKLNTVTYEYWNASYPYDSMKYNGEIINWFYTFDYSDIYIYSTYWDTYIDQSDLSVTYIYVNMQGYSVTLNKVSVLRPDDTKVPYYTTLPNGFRVYKDTASSAIRTYRVKTFIQATDGSVDLYNNVFIDRSVL